MKYDFAAAQAKVKAKGKKGRGKGTVINIEKYEPQGEPEENFAGVLKYPILDIDGTRVIVGTEMTFEGEGNKKFKFRSYTVNPKTGAEWMDLSAPDGRYRALGVDKIKKVF